MVCATYGDGNYFPPSFHRLISNRFSHRPEPFLWSKGTGLHICALPLHKRGKVGAKESPDLIWNHWSLPVLKWRWKEEAAHNPSDMWCPLLCLLKFCGWEGKQSVGLILFFYANAPLLENCLLLIEFKIPKGKGLISFLYCAWCPTHYGWLINVMSFSYCTKNGIFPSVLLASVSQQISLSAYISQEKGTV